MESCSLLDSDWERWGLWGDSSHNNDDVFDFSSPVDQSLISGLEDANNNDGKSDLFAKWMDEKLDLSIMHMEGQPGLLDDLDVMIEDPTALLENLMDWSSEILENELGNLNSKLEKNNEVIEALPDSRYVATPDSPGGRVPDNSFAMSPENQQESFYVKPIDDKNPSVDDKSESIDDLANYLNIELNPPDVSELSANYSNSQLSPSTSVSSIETLDSIDSKDACVLSCNSPATENSPPVRISPICFDSENDTLEDSKEVEVVVTRLTKKRSQNRKKTVSASNSAAPGEFRRERKRKQNKDAATRYRQKKRKEGVAVKGEESILENRNKELKEHVQQLSNEISYLKGLLKEAKLRMQFSESSKSSLSKAD